LAGDGEQHEDIARALKAVEAAIGETGLRAGLSARQCALVLSVAVGEIISQKCVLDHHRAMVRLCTDTIDQYVNDYAPPPLRSK
jgi:hypothetical protein